MMTGPSLQRTLSHAFPLLSECTRKQDTGLYELVFSHPGWKYPVQPAQEIAQQIPVHLKNATPVHYQDTIADWREGQPVIAAAVTLRLTRFVVGQRVDVPIKVTAATGEIERTLQRKSAIHEVNANPKLSQVYYRVSLYTGMDHYWVSEDVLLRANPKVGQAKTELVIPREKALMVLPDAA